MTEGVDRVTVRRDGLTVAALLWQIEAAPTAGRVERVLDLNPGLAGNLTIPVGTVVLVPRRAGPEEPVDVISLWG
ncbi:MAG: hypothetical protein AUK37_01620 [Rhodobacterales bacterium CG2_30_65_12]|nr:MAG: hypothetical protein AUK37_01620 [Rhodobacterales bacterium CG2_30_65_12]